MRIALDDFGTGYSSLSYLQRFPFDKIKIDRCFISDIATPGGSLSIVQAIVALARARNMTTTAEGVETPPSNWTCCARAAAPSCRVTCSAPAKPAAAIRQLLFAHRERSTAVSPDRERKRRQVPSTA